MKAAEVDSAVVNGEALKRLVMSSEHASMLHRDGAVDVVRRLVLPKFIKSDDGPMTVDHGPLAKAVAWQPARYVPGFGYPDEWQAVMPGGFATYLERHPFGLEGDRRWVAETWAIMFDHDPRSGELCDFVQERKRPNGNVSDIAYRSTAPYFEWVDGDGFYEYRRDGSPASHWRSAAIMPRWAAQSTVTLTNQRVTLDDGAWNWRATATLDKAAT